MKAAAFAVALGITAVCAFAASAQDAAPPPAPAQVAPPPSDAPAVDMHALCNRPDVINAGRFYPRRAMEGHISGDAALDCAFDADGKPSSCQIVHEAPANYHFGDASLRIMCRARYAPLAGSNGASSDMIVYERDGQARIRQTVRFRLAQERLPDPAPPRRPPSDSQ